MSTKTVQQGQTLREVYEKSRMNADDFARQFDITRSALYRLFDQEFIPGRHWERLQQLKAALRMEVAEEPAVYETAKKRASRGVPVFNTEATGGDITQYSDAGENIMGYIDLPAFSKCVGFVYLKGNSMYPDIKSGDLIGLEEVQDIEVLQWGLPYMIVTADGQRFVKLLRKHPDPTYYILRSVNPDYDDIEVKRTKVLKMYRVRGPVRSDFQ